MLEDRRSCIFLAGEQETRKIPCWWTGVPRDNWLEDNPLDTVHSWRTRGLVDTWLEDRRSCRYLVGGQEALYISGWRRAGDSEVT
jgi:hypothetical protein